MGGGYHHLRKHPYTWFNSGREFMHLPSGKLTWQWKMDQLKMYSLLKMVIFHCHVSLLEGICIGMGIVQLMSILFIPVVFCCCKEPLMSRAEFFTDSPVVHCVSRDPGDEFWDSLGGHIQTAWTVKHLKTAWRTNIWPNGNENRQFFEAFINGVVFLKTLVSVLGEVLA